jgi:hypothetical protein
MISKTTKGIPWYQIDSTLDAGKTKNHVVKLFPWNTICRFVAVSTHPKLRHRLDGHCLLLMWLPETIIVVVRLVDPSFILLKDE